MEALIGFYIMVAIWMTVLTFKIRSLENENRKNKVSGARNLDELYDIKFILKYGKEKGIDQSEVRRGSQREDREN